MGASFDGNNDRVEVARYAALEPSAVSISYWIRRRATESAGDVYMAKRYGTWSIPTVMSYGLRRGATGANYITACIGYSGSRYEMESLSAPMTTTNWRHVVLTYDPSLGSNQLKLYIDGVLDNSANLSQAILYDTNEGLFFTTTFWHLQHDGADGRVYNRVLSAAEIETMFNCRGTDGITHGLVARFFFREQAPGVAMSGTVPNYSEGNNGTVGNAPAWGEDPLVGSRRRAA